jgi:hypothetical protein
MNKTKVFLSIIGLTALIFCLSQPSEKAKSNSIESQCAPIPEDLVFWLRAENNANDFFRVHDGILNGDTSFSAGKVGEAFEFDGYGDFVLIPYTDELLFRSDPRTIEMWIYSVSDSWMQDYRTPFFMGLDSIHAAFGIDFDDYPTLQFITWTEDLYIDTDLEKVGWFHVAMVYDGDTLLSAYINGVLVDSLELSDVLDTAISDILIGGGKDGSMNPTYYIGKIDEISLYRRALTGEEILAIYNAGSYGKCYYFDYLPLISH